jgi:hypothetical protein
MASPAFEFAAEMLKSNPEASFDDVVAAAAKKKLKIIPVVYGRAKSWCGINKAPKTKVAKTNGVAAPTTVKRGRPTKAEALAKAALLDGRTKAGRAAAGRTSAASSEGAAPQRTARGTRANSKNGDVRGHLTKAAEYIALAEGQLKMAGVPAKISIRS